MTAPSSDCRRCRACPPWPSWSRASSWRAPVKAATTMAARDHVSRCGTHTDSSPVRARTYTRMRASACVRAHTRAPMKRLRSTDEKRRSTRRDHPGRASGLVPILCLPGPEVSLDHLSLPRLPSLISNSPSFVHLSPHFSSGSLPRQHLQTPPSPFAYTSDSITHLAQRCAQHGKPGVPHAAEPGHVPPPATPGTPPPPRGPAAAAARPRQQQPHRRRPRHRLRLPADTAQPQQQHATEQL
jgi:hypothetical protein